MTDIREESGGRVATRNLILYEPNAEVVFDAVVPEYLAGLYPRPASIDLGNRMLAELALDELLRRISGAPGRADHVAVIATPQLVPGER